MILLLTIFLLPAVLWSALEAYNNKDFPAISIFVILTWLEGILCWACF